jgi:hypothetical protein
LTKNKTINPAKPEIKQAPNRATKFSNIFPLKNSSSELTNSIKKIKEIDIHNIAFFLGSKNFI